MQQPAKDHPETGAGVLNGDGKKADAVGYAPPAADGANGNTVIGVKRERPARQQKTQEQWAGLEAAFLMDSYPSEEQYQRLATNLVLSVIQVREWFCNRRKWGRASPSSPAGGPGGEAKATAAGAAGSPQAGTSGPRDLGGVSDAPAVFCSVAGEGQKDVDSPATGGTVICITETGKPLPAGEEASLKFLTSLRRFILLKTDGMDLGIGAYRIPRLGGEEVNLPQLYRSVVMCGGYHKTIQKGSWSAVVAFHMGVPSTVTNAAYMLRVHYEKFLLEYEYTFWDNPDIEMDLLRNTRFTREQVLLSPVPSGPPNLNPPKASHRASLASHSSSAPVMPRHIPSVSQNSTR